MSDRSAAEALRSAHRLVVVEAPAGCGKTRQAADYARDRAATIAPGRLLILTHTHAACDVIAARTREHPRVEIRTIDSLISQIGSAYHVALGLPEDAASWARERGEGGYTELASKVARLLQRTPTIARALAHRYPVVVCDEHQDSSADQHATVIALMKAGADLRVFGDPMQRIFLSKKDAQRKADAKRWEDFIVSAGTVEKLDCPHRWGDPPSPLGLWILETREALRGGGKIDLRGELPQGLQIVFADNRASRHGQFMLAKGERGSIDQFVRASTELFVLTRHRDVARGLRAFFGRSIPLWEGHTREELGRLVSKLKKAAGDPNEVAEATVSFLGAVACGFRPSQHGKVLVEEVATRCSTRRRGMPASIQELARLILETPDHRGVGRLLRKLEGFVQDRPGFEEIAFDLRCEFWDATKLADFDNADEGLSEIARMRTYARRPPPTRAVSTIHKAKGLECPHVLIMPCDAKAFSDNELSRNLLYVALSRATRSLMVVVSRQQPSPVLQLA